MSGDNIPASIEIEQIFGYFLDRFSYVILDILPLCSTQAAGSRGTVIRTDVTGEAVHLVDWDEQLGLIGILDAQIFSLQSIDRAPDETLQLANPMIDVDDPISRL